MDLEYLIGAIILALVLALGPVRHYTRSRFSVHTNEASAEASAQQDLPERSTFGEQVFAKAYEKEVWGSAESCSGRGSEVGATPSLRPYLRELFDRLSIRTVLDAPCGDWNWMKLVDLTGVSYVGVDVVSKVIEENRNRFSSPSVRFMVADLRKDNLPSAELILCRDCWVHLSFEDIGAVLENFRRSGAKWLLVSNTPEHEMNLDQATGLSWRHLNLTLPPFNFPPPIESRKDHYPDTPFKITLWQISDLPRVNPT